MTGDVPLFTAMRRVGSLLWTQRLDLDGTPNEAGIPAIVEWRDAQSLELRGSVGLRVTSQFALVSNTIWVGTNNGVVRLNSTDGTRLDTVQPLEGRRVIVIADTVRTSTSDPRVTYAAIVDAAQRVALARLDATSGATQLIGPPLGGGPAGEGFIAGGAVVSAGTRDVWLTYPTGLIGGVLRVNPASLEATPTPLAGTLRPIVRQGEGILWYVSAGRDVGCVNPNTGELLWSLAGSGDVDNVSLAVGPNGGARPYRQWQPIVADPVCFVQVSPDPSTTTTTTPAPPTTPPVATRGRCRGPVPSATQAGSLSGDFDGDGIADKALAFRKPFDARVPTRSNAVLQTSFGDGGLSDALDIETADMFAAVDLDGDGTDELLISLSGNTAHPGGIVAVDACAPRFVNDANKQRRFVYVKGAGGPGCAPACYPSVECRSIGRGHELVVYEADQQGSSGVDVPPLNDDLVYAWSIDRWRYIDGAMVNVDHQEGQTRHADLPVPKRQGVHCT